MDEAAADSTNLRNEVDVTWPSNLSEERELREDDPARSKDVEELLIPLRLIAENTEITADATAVQLLFSEETTGLLTSVIEKMGTSAEKSETASAKMESYTNQLRLLTYALAGMTLVLLIAGIVQCSVALAAS